MTSPTAYEWSFDVPEPKSSKLEGDAIIGYRLGIVAGGAFCLISTLLSWVSSGDAAPLLDRSVFQLGQNFGATLLGPTMIVLGLAIVTLGLAVGHNFAQRDHFATWIIVVAQAATITTAVSWGRLTDLVTHTDATSSLAHGAIGIGFWSACIGSGLALAFGIALRIKSAQMFVRPPTE